MYWWTAVDLVRCEALDCTIFRLYDDTVVVARQPIVEFDITDRLSDKAIVGTPVPPNGELNAT